MMKQFNITSNPWYLYALLLFIKLVIGQVTDEKPKITEGPSNVVVSRGKTAELKCSVYGSPTPTVQWFKNNVLLDTSNDRLVKGVGSLIINKIQRSSRRTDEGVYYCVAINKAGKATSDNATLTVTYLSRKYREHPANLSSVLDGTVRFYCKPPEGYPRAAVSWYINGQLIPSSNRFQRIIDGNRYELKIEPVKLEDAGSYVCVASNTADRRESEPGILYIRAKPTAAIVSQSTNIYEGDTREFVCRVTGVPAPTIQWTKDGSSIPFSARVRLIGDTKLAVQNAELGDSGTYKCTVQNAEGSAESTASLTVLREPVFITRPTQLSIGVGQTAKLECEVSGEPGLTLFWQKLIRSSLVETLIFPGQPYDGRLLVSSDGLLTITNVQKKDAAIYICTVHSGPKTISASAKLTVLENSTPPPIVTLTPDNQTVAEESNVTLTCTVSGIPLPTVKWEYGSSNLLITNSADGITLKSNGTKNYLIFNNIKRSSTGSYRCFASNSGGTAAKLAYLYVKLLLKVPNPPQNIAIKNITASSLTLQWAPAVTMASTPIISYDIDFLSMDFGLRWQVLVKSVDGTTFKVVGLMPDTRYRFSVRAINRVGGSARSAPSDVIRTLVASTAPPSIITSVKPTIVDKLLNLKLDLSLYPYNRDSLQLVWKAVKPADRIQGFYIYWRKLGAEKYERLDLIGNHISSYILSKLERDTAYEVKMQAFNERYTSPMSYVMALKTISHIAFPPPEDVRVAQGGEGQILVTWKAPWKTIVSHDVIGYKITCISPSSTVPNIKSVGKNITSYIIKGLIPSDEYVVTVAVVTNEGDGIASGKKAIILAGGTDTGVVIPTAPLPPLITNGSVHQPSAFIRILKSTWFIATVGGILWLILLLIVLFIICKRRKRSKRKNKTSMFSEQAKSLLTDNKGVNGETNIMQSGLIYTDHSAFWSSSQIGGGDGTLNGGNRSLKHAKKINADGSVITDGVYFKQFNAPGESFEMKTTDSFHPTKPINHPMQVENNPSLPRYKTGNPESWRDAARNAPPNLISNPLAIRDRSENGSQERPRLKIHNAFEAGQGSGDESNHTTERRKKFSRDEKQNTAERINEIKRKGKPLDHSPTDDNIDDNKSDVNAPGNDTLRRKMKSPFKPVPKLTMMNWADVLPGPPSKPPSSMGSPPDSPKLSMFNENVGRSSRMSHGSNGSVHRYPYNSGGGGGGSRSHRAPSVSSRRLSQSSMMSSELYQSEMDPSHSEVHSERKKHRTKPVPPPVELEGLTSDILLQWAESVTNSSPSSSGSSSPSRMSVVSSTGSFFNDEEFAQAVAAVAECGGFNMETDYSLTGCSAPTLTKEKLNRLEQSKHRMDRVDAMIASGARFPRPVQPSSISNGHKTRGDRPSPSPVPAISLSNYLLGPNKKAGSVASAPIEHQSGHPKQRSRSSRQPSLDNGNFDSASNPGGTALTTSNLHDHDYAIDNKQGTPPLTVNNLKHHESSLERQHKHNFATPKHPAPNGDPQRSLKRSSKRSPPSIKSASLERGGTSNGHTSPPPRGHNSADRKSKRKHFVNLLDPNSSTSTASTVRTTTPDTMDC